MVGSENELQIFYYGVRIRITGNSDPLSQDVLKRLKKDLGWFRAQSLLDFDSPSVEILIEGSNPPKNPAQKLRRVFERESCQVYGFGKKRVCDYGNGLLTIVESQSNSRRIQVYAKTADELYQAASSAFLSALGEELDSKGYHRIDALGIEYGGFAFLMMLPAGDAKSKMASVLNTTSEASVIRVLSDQMPIAHEDWICPFPLKIPPAKVGEESLCQAIFISQSTDGAPGIERASRFQILKSLWKNMILGVGTQQRPELMLRLNALPKLIRIALSRLITAFNLLSSSETYLFQLSPDPKLNVQVLSRFLQKYPPKELELLRQKRA